MLTIRCKSSSAPSFVPRSQHVSHHLFVAGTVCARRNKADVTDCTTCSAARPLPRCPGTLTVTVIAGRKLRNLDGPSSPKIRAPLFAARTLNATGQYRVTLSLR